MKRQSGEEKIGNLSAPWLEPIVLERLEAEWDEVPASSGVYIIRRRRPVSRLGGADRRGILYIGKAGNLRERLWQFWYADHGAGWYLWRQPALARVVLSSGIRTITDVERHLGKLSVVLAAPIARAVLDRAERAVLCAYIARFGEAPPLNFSLPQRWADAPLPEDLRWAEKGILRGG